jgi:hypothetical protein
VTGDSYHYTMFIEWVNSALKSKSNQNYILNLFSVKTSLLYIQDHLSTGGLEK